MTSDTLEAPATTTDTGTQVAPPAAVETPATLVEQGAEATATADNPPAAESEPAAQVAAEYEAFSLPEGVTADEEVLGEFKATAKELGLSQEGAQKLVELQSKVALKQQEAMRHMKTQWAEAAKTDKEFGGEALNENLSVAKKALDAFASPDLRALLNESGLGNHPEVIRHFIRVGKAISEDGRVVSGTKAVTPSDPARRLFPNHS
jgi:hypothetical protein